MERFARVSFAGIPLLRNSDYKDGPSLNLQVRVEFRTPPSLRKQWSLDFRNSGRRKGTSRVRVHRGKHLPIPAQCTTPTNPAGMGVEGGQVTASLPTKERPRAKPALLRSGGGVRSKKKRPSKSCLVNRGAEWDLCPNQSQPEARSK